MRHCATIAVRGMEMVNHGAQQINTMKGPLRGLLAGAAAYKWGGGCLGTVLLFVIVYLLLGSC